MVKLVVAAAALLAASAPAAAVQAQAGAGVSLPAAVRQAADGITAARLKQDLDTIASDAFRGRNTPSAGLDSATAFIARRLQAAGLRPMGDDGGWIQTYELRDEQVDTAGAYLETDGRRFRFGEDFVIRSFAGPVTADAGVVYVGNGWSVPGAGVDPYANVDVRGRIVLAHGPDARPGNTPVQQIGRVLVGASSPFAEAHRRGAAAIIYIAQPATLNGWDRLRRANLTRLELHPIVPSAYAALPLTSVQVRPDVVAALFEGERIATAAGGTAAVSAAALSAAADSGRFPPSFELRRRVKLHVPAASSIVHRPGNVVAMIEGSDPLLKDEVITIASHLDGSVGRAVQDGDSVYNSADDNASGSVGNLAIAEQMMRAPRPKRSLLFIWDSGEERGLWGTRHFVNSPPVPLKNIVAHFNIDMIGATRAPGMGDSASANVAGPNEVYLTGPAVLSERADSLLARVNREYVGMIYNRIYDREDHEFFYPRTDAGPFLERGILTIGFQTGLHNRYHAPRDEAQFLDPSKIEAVSRSAFAAIWMMANAAERPAIERPIPLSVPRH